MKVKPLIIALDFDDTYTRDPEAWGVFTTMMRARGHSVYFVTFRQGPETLEPHGNDDIHEAAGKLGIPIVFTCHKQKRHVFNADIWIDDTPTTICSYEEMRGMVRGCEVNNDTEVNEDVQ